MEAPAPRAWCLQHPPLRGTKEASMQVPRTVSATEADACLHRQTGAHGISRVHGSGAGRPRTGITDSSWGITLALEVKKERLDHEPRSHPVRPEELSSVRRMAGEEPRGLPFYKELGRGRRGKHPGGDCSHRPPSAREPPACSTLGTDLGVLRACGPSAHPAQHSSPDGMCASLTSPP